jgi:hypothetical protein
MVFLKYFIILLLLPIVSAQITLYNADIKISELCLNKTSEITIIPHDIFGNMSIIDKVDITSDLNISNQQIIYENNTFIKQIIFKEIGKGKIYINISQEEKTLSFKKDIEVLEYF